jgi:hypothetical protein
MAPQLTKTRKHQESGVMMTEYAIVFFSVTLVFFLILDNMFIKTEHGYDIRQTIDMPIYNDSITNPLYGFKAYFQRINDFVALPIP